MRLRVEVKLTFRRIPVGKILSKRLIHAVRVDLSVLFVLLVVAPLQSAVAQPQSSQSQTSQAQTSQTQTQKPQTQQPPASQPPKIQTDPAAQNSDEFQKVFDNANILLRQGRIQDALNEFRRAAKLRDDKCAECFQRIGQVLLQIGQLKESAAALRQAAELKPANEAEMYNILGVVLYLQNEKASFDEAVVALQKAIELSSGKVVKSYYNLGFALIKSGKEQEGIEVLKKYVELDPGSSEVAQAKAVIGNVKLVDARVAPSFSVKSHTGDEISLEKSRGKIVLLDFWASWCVPCRAQAPIVDRVSKSNKARGLVALGVVSGDAPEDAAAFMAQHPVSYDSVVDDQGAASRAFHVNSLPTIVAIDAKGEVKAVRNGLVSEKELSALVEAILPSK